MMRAISLIILCVILVIPGSGKSKKNVSFNIMTYNIRMNTPDDGVFSFGNHALKNRVGSYSDHSDYAV